MMFKIPGGGGEEIRSSCHHSCLLCLYGGLRVEKSNKGTIQQHGL